MGIFIIHIKSQDHSTISNTSHYDKNENYASKSDNLPLKLLEEFTEVLVIQWKEFADNDQVGETSQKVTNDSN